MRGGFVPKGQTRISDAVVDAIAVVAARKVQGVVDVVGLARGASPGPVDGEEDGDRSLREAPADMVFHKKNQEIPALRLHLSAEEGVDLPHLADDIREQVHASVRAIAHLDMQGVEVIFTEIVHPDEPYGDELSS